MFAAMLAKETSLSSAAALVLDDEWVLEQKLDGHRVLAEVGDADVRVYNRLASRYTKGFPDDAAKMLIDAFRPGSIVDGELVGKTYWAFDLIKHGDRELIEVEYVERRSHLRHKDYKHILPQARTSEAKARLMRRVRDEGGEGVIAKNLYSPYVPGGRTGHMLKAKYVKTIDCIVIELERNGKEAIGLGVLGEDGKLTEIGACSMIGKGDVAIGDVVMVRYLYALHPDRPRLYQPSFLEKRDDKRPADCTIDQVKFTDKDQVILP